MRKCRLERQENKLAIALAIALQGDLNNVEDDEELVQCQSTIYTL